MTEHDTVARLCCRLLQSLFDFLFGNMVRHAPTVCVHMQAVSLAGCVYPSRTCTHSVQAKWGGIIFIAGAWVLLGFLLGPLALRYRRCVAV